MSLFKWRIAVGAAAGLLGFTLIVLAASDAGVETLPNRTYLHTDSKVSLFVPLGWQINAPYRLRKTTTSSVLGLEKENPRMAVTILFSPLGKQPWSEVIRATVGDDLGDEYATLVTVYGKPKVGRPTTMKVGPFTVFKVLLDDGPDKISQNAGALYLFEAGSGENRWKVRVRAVYPQANREEAIKQVEEVLAQFALVE